jgi:hypothetical protein
MVTLMLVAENCCSGEILQMKKWYAYATPTRDVKLKRQNWFQRLGCMHLPFLAVGIQRFGTHMRPLGLFPYTSEINGNTS